MSTERTPPPPGRRALLDAAATLFGELGYGATTTRLIGEHAGVDPALIARYFESKAGLYLATLATDGAELRLSGVPDELRADIRTTATFVIERLERRGPGPILQAIIRADTDPELRASAEDRLGRILVEPLASCFERAGVDRAQVMAETAVAALVGIGVLRSVASLKALSEATREEAIQLAVDTIEALVGKERLIATSGASCPKPTATLGKSATV